MNITTYMYILFLYMHYILFTTCTVYTNCVCGVFTDVDPDESYLVRVFPVYNQLCGSPQSLTASLQQGGKHGPSQSFWWWW